MTILARHGFCERDKICSAEFYGTRLGLGLKSRAPVAKDCEILARRFKTTLMPLRPLCLKCGILLWRFSNSAPNGNCAKF
ncbi:hypothetical protein [uncultured Campylobacter sp.]|uniref:hypothetical protein n=1 Tax=uncultured Campylobacter sp. TaxID=218934 RepID=UPI0026099138|nr:hypothetical protein [uncultured Campylobacter sp.]